MNKDKIEKMMYGLGIDHSTVRRVIRSREEIENLWAKKKQLIEQIKVAEGEFEKELRSLENDKISLNDISYLFDLFEYSMKDK